jgi:hypothetical protein
MYMYCRFLGKGKRKNQEPQENESKNIMKCLTNKFLIALIQFPLLSVTQLQLTFPVTTITETETEESTRNYIHYIYIVGSVSLFVYSDWDSSFFIFIFIHIAFAEFSSLSLVLACTHQLSVFSHAQYASQSS